jgi:hypothetical protein
MHRYFLASLCVSLFASAALCQDPPRGEGPAKPPEPLKAPTEKPVAPAAPCGCKGPTLKEHQILVVPVQSATTLPRVEIREERADAKELVLEVVYEEQERKIMELVMEPKEIKQKITCTKMEKKEVVDCNGCKRTVWCEVPYEETVTVTQMRCVEKERTIIVKVACLKPVVRDVVLKRLAVDVTKQPAIATRFTMSEIKQELPVPTCPSVCPPVMIVPGPSKCGCKK